MKYTYFFTKYFSYIKNEVKTPSKMIYRYTNHITQINTHYIFLC